MAHSLQKSYDNDDENQDEMSKSESDTSQFTAERERLQRQIAKQEEKLKHIQLEEIRVGSKKNRQPRRFSQRSETVEHMRVSMPLILDDQACKKADELYCLLSLSQF